jgi:hypothetical protein
VTSYPYPRDYWGRHNDARAMPKRDTWGTRGVYPPEMDKLVFMPFKPPTPESRSATAYRKGRFRNKE